MPPRKKEMSKSEMKKVEKFVEDKTFGLKNKNKSGMERSVLSHS